MYVFRMASRERENFSRSPASWMLGDIEHSTGLSPWLQRKYTHNQEGTL
jgi:hypothetical protein